MIKTANSVISIFSILIASRSWYKFLTGFFFHLHEITSRKTRAKVYKIFIQFSHDYFLTRNSHEMINVNFALNFKEFPSCVFT